MTKKWKIFLGTFGAIGFAAALSPAFIACSTNSSANDVDSVAQQINNIEGQDINEYGFSSVNGMANAADLHFTSETTLQSLTTTDKADLQAIFQVFLNQAINNSYVQLPGKDTASQFTLNLSNNVVFHQNALSAQIIFTNQGKQSVSSEQINLDGFGMDLATEAQLLATTIGNTPVEMSLYYNATPDLQEPFSNTTQQIINYGLQHYILNQQKTFVSMNIPASDFTVDFAKATLTKVTNGMELVTPINFTYQTTVGSQTKTTTVTSTTTVNLLFTNFVDHAPKDSTVNGPVDNN